MAHHQPSNGNQLNVPPASRRHSVPPQASGLRPLPPSLFLFLLLLFPVISNADALLLTLQTASNILALDDEFTVTMEIYGASTSGEPEVGVEGLEAFRLLNLKKDRLEVPGGKTVKWLYTYKLAAVKQGVFKFGPARAISSGRAFLSNTLFLTVEKGRPSKTLVPPIVTSSKEIGNKVVLLLEADKSRPYTGEGFTVQIRLLSQLPVENLRFRDEPDFPGFLKYDYPLIAHPQAVRLHYQGQTYVTYDLVRFLLFPLNPGKQHLPSVIADLKVRIMSGSYRQADLILETERRSNHLSIEAQPPPRDVALIGNFSLRSEPVSSLGRSVIIRRVMEGQGLLSFFEFPLPEEKGFLVRPVKNTTSASIQGKSLFSRKVQELEIISDGSTTDLVLTKNQFRQFDPLTKKTSVLLLPSLPVKFERLSSLPIEVSPFPGYQDRLMPVVLLFTFLSLAVVFVKAFGPRRSKKRLALEKLWARKKMDLSISKKAAHVLYQQLCRQVLEQEPEGVTLIDIVRIHLPREEWLVAERTLRKLEWNAFAPAEVVSLTYAELKDMCERIQRRWNQ